jgi:hypothetical protein
VARISPAVRGLHLHVRIGDWLILIAASGLVLWLGINSWRSQDGDMVIVRNGGQVIAELPLSRDQVAHAVGPLGATTIQIKDGRVRIQADPSPRQYCVKQGWIDRTGQSAICLPNQVSIQISGNAYDSLNY